MPKGIRYGGRKPLSPAGPGLPVRFKFPRELVADLQELAEALGRPGADIVRDGTVKEVARLKRLVEKRGQK